jgi:hypothetical protein
MTRGVGRHLAWTLDLGPVVRLQKRMWRCAFFTGLGVYLQAIAAFVLLTEQSLSPAALVLIIAILIGELILIYHPVRKFLRGQLVRSYQIYLVLLAGFIVTIWAGSRAGDDRILAGFLSVLVASVPAWVAVGGIRMERAVRPQLGSLRDDTVLLESLSFSVGVWFTARLRAFGGDRRRWAALAVAAGAAFVGVAALLALLARAIDVSAGSPVAQVATVVTIFVFYMGMRHLKLSASQLRKRDSRAPVLILRQFGDDFLESGRMSLGGSPTFEHFIAGELNRIGPVVAIGRPGERLQPLGASRDYLVERDWRGAVGTTIAAAALVVFVLGDSESLLWEFRTTVETRGKRRALIIVPPLRDRDELARRWARFVKASADLLGAGFPGELPKRSVLAIGFAGEDAVMMVSDERPRARASLVRSRSDYRLLFRLFERVLRPEVASAQALEELLGDTIPIARLSPTISRI